MDHLTQQLAESSEREVELIITNDILKSNLITIRKQTSALLESHNKALLQADSLSIELAICPTQLQAALAEQEETQLQIGQLKEELASEICKNALSRRRRI